jgi:hypothetical protein
MPREVNDMLDRALVIEYWQEPTGRFLAEARHLPIRASGETLVLLKANLVEQIRDAYRGSPLPSVYDLVRKDEPPTAALAASGAGQAA